MGHLLSSVWLFWSLAHGGRATGPAHCIKRSFGLISSPVVSFCQVLDKGSLSATEQGWHWHAVKWELIDILLGTSLRPWATQLLCKEGGSWAQRYICLTRFVSLSPKWIFLVRWHVLAPCFCQPFLPRGWDESVSSVSFCLRIRWKCWQEACLVHILSFHLYWRIHWLSHPPVSKWRRKGPYWYVKKMKATVNILRLSPPPTFKNRSPNIRHFAKQQFGSSEFSLR